MSLSTNLVASRVKLVYGVYDLVFRSYN